MREIMLIVHFLGLAMGLGTGFANLFVGLAAAKMETAEAAKFRMQSAVLIRMGHIGLGLLIISGFYLITPYWATLTAMPFLMIKLALVICLVTLVSILTVKVRKAKQSSTPPDFEKLALLGKITLLITISIVVMAVYSFH